MEYCAHHISVINAYRLVHAVLGLKSHEKTEACQFHYMRCGKQFVGRLLEHRIKNVGFSSPVASVTILPVVPVAHKLWRLSTPQYAMQNCTINSFFASCAIKAMFTIAPPFTYKFETEDYYNLSSGNRGTDSPSRRAANRCKAIAPGERE